jgi:hypothetical protein
MQPSGVTLMLFARSEEGNELIPFYFIKGRMKTSRIFQAAYKTHPGIMLFTSDFFGHGSSSLGRSCDPILAGFGPSLQPIEICVPGFIDE